MGFTDLLIKHVGDDILNKIPAGPTIGVNEKVVSVFSKTHVHSQLAAERKAAADSTSTGGSASGSASASGRGNTGKAHTVSAKSKQYEQKLKLAFSGAEHEQVVAESNLLVHKFLKNVSDVINRRTMGCWGDDYGGSRDDYLKGQWEDVLQGVPVMVYPLCTGKK